MSNFAILFVLVYFNGLALSLVKGAHWAFYLYQLVYFLNPEKRWWSAVLPLSNYSLITIVFLLLSYIIHRNKLQYYLNELNKIPQFKWIILLMISYSFTYFTAVNKAIHLEALIDFAKLFIIIGLAFKVLDTRKKLEYAIYALITGIAYLGYEVYSIGRDGQGRVDRFGMIDAPDVNVATAAMISSLPFLIFFFWKGSLKIKIIMVILGGVIVNGIVLANSRGAFVGGLIGVLYFVWEMLRSRFKARLQRLVTVLLIIGGLISLYAVVDTSFIDRMTTLTEVSEGEGGGGSRRVEYWKIALDVVEEHPFGVGSFGFEILSPEYVPAEYFDPGKTQKAVHSIWFQALTELGYIGFIFFMMIIYVSYQSLKKIKVCFLELNDIHGYYFTHALLSSYIGVLAASSFINQFRTQIVYWLVLFTACLFNIVMLRRNSS